MIAVIQIRQKIIKGFHTIIIIIKILLIGWHVDVLLSMPLVWPYFTTEGNPALNDTLQIYEITFVAHTQKKNKKKNG